MEFKRLKASEGSTQRIKHTYLNNFCRDNIISKESNFFQFQNLWSTIFFVFFCEKPSLSKCLKKRPSVHIQFRQLRQLFYWIRHLLVFKVKTFFSFPPNFVQLLLFWSSDSYLGKGSKFTWEKKRKKFLSWIRSFFLSHTKSSK